jgi:uncharacterized membrane protein YdbT with pleckstrin-like domain
VPFPRKLLNDNEDVILDLRPHWWFLSGPVAALVFFIVLSIVVQSQVDNDPATIASVVPVVLSMLWFVGRYMKWTTTNFVLTTDRLIYRSGVVGKRGKEIPLERLNDISFNQSVFERLIGAGDLLIESGGERGQQAFTDIRRPAQVQNEIYRQIEAGQARDAERMSGFRGLSVPEQLEKLDDLRRRGVVSQAEFDAKKAKLLDQL